MRTLGRTLFEFVVVAVFGCAIGLAANAASRKGLDFKRDYFHVRRAPVAAISPATQPTTQAAGRATSRPGDNDVAADLRASGLQPLQHEEAEAVFKDPSRAAGLYIFVDARNDEHYEEGHIPGALQFDRYHPEPYFPKVMPAAQAATKVIVYCGGGECEDSKFAALELLNQGLDPKKVFVYLGGIKEWGRRGLPMETGRK